jgi:hypothetical protein
VTDLLLKRAATSRPSGQWSDDDYDVLADGVVVGRIFKANAAPAEPYWMEVQSWLKEIEAGAALENCRALVNQCRAVYGRSPS